MLKVKGTQLGSMVGMHFNNNIPLFIYGGFGIGKSAIVRQEAKQKAKDKGKEFVEWSNTTVEEQDNIMAKPSKYFLLIDQRLSQFEPSDIKGLPKFDGQGKYLEWSIPKWLEILTNKDVEGILFFDEMNLAAPSILASCYQLFHDRVVNDKKLSDKVFILGAGNRLSDMAHTFDMPLPLRDRSSEVELVMDTDEWFDWAFANNIHSDILAFLRFKPEFLLKVDKDRDNKSITPRGWERTSILISNNKATTWKMLTSGSIGDGVANEFIAFTKLQKNVDLDKILAEPASIKSVEGVDLKYSLISGLAQKFKSDKKNFGKIIEVVSFLEPEYGMLTLKLLKATNETFFKTNIVKEKTWKTKLAGEYGKYLL